VRHAIWTDIDFMQGTVKVTRKDATKNQDWKFDPKSKRVREVPSPISSWICCKMPRRGRSRASSFRPASLESSNAHQVESGPTNSRILQSDCLPSRLNCGDCENYAATSARLLRVASSSTFTNSGTHSQPCRSKRSWRDATNRRSSAMPTSAWTTSTSSSMPG